jgi:hypothetical protein
LSNPALAEYVKAIDPRGVDTVRQLDEAIREAHADFDVAIKYRILMYALNEDWRHWIVAINARKNGISLQFLHGVLLDDPRKVLRKGTSVLMTWDIAFDEKVDMAAVGDYVRDAVAKLPHYKANEREILEAARTSSRA